jgi:hypothetical protein
MKTAPAILVIGRHKQIMETVLRLLNGQEGWRAIGALTDGEAKIRFTETKFDLVLIGGGVEEKSEQLLRLEFEKTNPQTKIIRHYGGGNQSLFNEIHEAIKL